MKNLLLPLIFCLALFGNSFAQPHQGDYKKIDYINIDQTDLDRFLTVSNSEYPAGYKSLIESDDITSWCLYKVKYPGGKESEYNFISVTTAPSINALDKLFSDQDAPGFIPSSVSDHGKEQLSKVATLVKSEIWAVENHVHADTGALPSKYMTMDYMNVATGKNPDYLMLEDEIAKPIHLERIDRDRMAGWEVFSLVLPGGQNYGYNFATGNHFDELEHFEFGINEEIIRHTMGENSNVPELFDTIYNTRDLVKVELWELVNHLQ